MVDITKVESNTDLSRFNVQAQLETVTPVTTDTDLSRFTLIEQPAVQVPVAATIDPLLQTATQRPISAREQDVLAARAISGITPTVQEQITTITAIPGQIKRAFTGEERETPETIALPELGEIDFGNAANIKLAAKTLFTASIEGRLNFLKDIDPNIGVRTDEKGNVFVTPTIGDTAGQEFVVNKPGFSIQDSISLAADIAIFIPAAGLRTVTKVAAATGLTDIIQQLGAKLLGSQEDLDLTRTALIATGGGIGKKLEPSFAVMAQRVTQTVKDFVERSKLGQLTAKGRVTERDTLIKLSDELDIELGTTDLFKPDPNTTIGGLRIKLRDLIESLPFGAKGVKVEQAKRIEDAVNKLAAGDSLTIADDAVDVVKVIQEQIDNLGSEITLTPKVVADEGVAVLPPTVTTTPETIDLISAIDRAPIGIVNRAIGRVDAKRVQAVKGGPAAITILQKTASAASNKITKGVKEIVKKLKLSPIIKAGVATILKKKTLTIDDIRDIAISINFDAVAAQNIIKKAIDTPTLTPKNIVGFTINNMKNLNSVIPMSAEFTSKLQTFIKNISNNFESGKFNINTDSDIELINAAFAQFIDRNASSIKQSVIKFVSDDGTGSLMVAVRNLVTKGIKADAVIKNKFLKTKVGEAANENIIKQHLQTADDLAPAMKREFKKLFKSLVIKTRKSGDKVVRLDTSVRDLDQAVKATEDLLKLNNNLNEITTKLNDDIININKSNPVILNTAGLANESAPVVREVARRVNNQLKENAAVAKTAVTGTDVKLKDTTQQISGLDAAIKNSRRADVAIGRTGAEFDIDEVIADLLEFNDLIGIDIAEKIKFNDVGLTLLTVGKEELPKKILQVFNKQFDIVGGSRTQNLIAAQNKRKFINNLNKVIKSVPKPAVEKLRALVLRDFINTNKNQLTKPGKLLELLDGPQQVLFKGQDEGVLRGLNRLFTLGDRPVSSAARKIAQSNLLPVAGIASLAVGGLTGSLTIGTFATVLFLNSVVQSKVMQKFLIKAASIKSQSKLIDFVNNNLERVAKEVTKGIEAGRIPSAITATQAAEEQINTQNVEDNN